MNFITCILKPINLKIAKNFKIDKNDILESAKS